MILSQFKSLILLAFPVLIFCIPIADLQATDFILPDTGQTQCYDDEKKTPCPLPDESFYGQDAQYVGLQPSYQDNTDGTVTDLVTGLMWQQDDGGFSYFWQEAVDYCEDLILGGFDDWRLPEMYELETLVNYSIPSPGPTIDTSYFPNTVSSNYWSSTTYASSTKYAWSVNFYYGGGYDYSSGRTFSRYVRCVRGGQGQSFNYLTLSDLSPDTADSRAAVNAFVDNGDETISDANTGLMWQQQDDGVQRNWQTALACCENNALGGYDDWRLPNVRELESIVDYANYSPAIDTSYFPNTVSSGYWSSTTYAYNADNAWYVYYGNGYGYYDGKSDRHYVRCVRGGQGGFLFPVYRFYNTETGAHFFTIDENEKDTILSNYLWFVYEGIAWRAYPADAHPDTSRPIYRFYNTNIGSHFFTMDENEKNTILANYDWFNYEGIAYYAYPVGTENPADTLPVYRFYNNDTGAHFFTTDEAEKDTIVLNYPWFQFEGKAWYAFAPGTTHP